MVEFGRKPPVAIVLIANAKLSRMFLSPNKYNKTATITMYNVKITVIVPNSSLM